MIKHADWLNNTTRLPESVAIEAAREFAELALQYTAPLSNFDAVVIMASAVGAMLRVRCGDDPLLLMRVIANFGAQMAGSVALTLDPAGQPGAPLPHPTHEGGRA